VRRPHLTWVMALALYALLLAIPVLLSALVAPSALAAR